MSHTEVYDLRAAERNIVNEVNRAVRRCRIGKIMWKRTAYQPISPVRIPSWAPSTGNPSPHLLPAGASPYRPQWWEQVTC